MIEKFKAEGRELYPILMTHLDPHLFEHFRFNKAKLKIHYIDDQNYDDRLRFGELIKKREDWKIKDFASQYLFHYNPMDDNREEDFKSLGIRKVFSDTRAFKEMINDEVNKYLNAEPFDPFAICFALRHRIEGIIYERLASQDLKDDFIKTHKTCNKLVFATEHGIDDIPESYFLLSIIYDLGLHAKNPKDDAKKLLRYLTNSTIKTMVLSLFPEFMK